MTAASEAGPAETAPVKAARHRRRRGPDPRLAPVAHYGECGHALSGIIGRYRQCMTG
jgi:hypothetical protein